MEKQLKKADTKKMAVLALLTAIAYISMLIFRLPMFDFLTYEVKDVIIVIGGFIFGPLASVIMSLVVSLVEMITISGTGPIGALMNFISTTAFVLPAVLIYNKKKSIISEIIGLSIGIITMTAVMILWNYIITPLYMGVPRDVVKGMLIPVFLPFNVFKAGMNSVLTLLLYVPLRLALSKAKLISFEEEKIPKKKTLFVILGFAAFLLLLFLLTFMLVAITGNYA